MTYQNSNRFVVAAKRLSVVAAVVGLRSVAIAAPDEGVVQTSSNAPAAADIARVAARTPLVRFSQEPPRVGDRFVQRVDVAMDVHTRITQSGQIANESTDAVRRRQQRVLDVLEVAEGRAVKFRASFPHSRRQSPELAGGRELVAQPIEGKSYLAYRKGDQLLVADLSGRTPPADELKLVAEALENVGKPNPLAELLLTRPLAVGERILVPRETAKSLLGLKDQVGDVRRFELTLLRVESVASEAGQSPRAVFQARIDVRANDVSPMSMNLVGELAVEVDTCRLLRGEFHGPVDMSSVERTEGGIFQYSAVGELAISTQTQFARR